MGKIYVSDVGTVLTLDVGEDISDATALRIQAQKPGGTTDSWVASASGTSALTYTLASGDIDETGVWRLQAKVTTPDGVWYGETLSLRIFPLFG